MIQTWLLFGVLAMVSGQIIYPDQYNKMSIGFASAPLPTNYPTLQVTSNNQPVQIDQQLVGERTSQLGTTKPIEEQFYSTTTHVPLPSSTNPTASPQLMPETWANHVNNYSVICMCNYDNYFLYIFKSFIYIFFKFLFKVF